MTATSTPPAAKVTPSTLIARVDDFLDALAGSPGHDLGPRGGSPRAAADALYEAYVYTLVAEAVEGLTGVPPVPVTHAGKFRVRRAPGELHTTRGSYSYLEVRRGARRYELHLDTYVGPRAKGAKLEADVLLVTAPSARRVRASASKKAKRRPGFRTAKLVLECKYLGGKLDTTLATSHLGRWQQLGRPGAAYMLVSNAALTENAAVLFGGCGLSAFERVLPAKWAEPNERKFVEKVRLRLGKVLV